MSGADEQTPPVWSHPARIAFRFTCAYLTLYALPLLVDSLPFVSIVADWWERATNAFAVWAGAHILGLSEPIAVTVTGSGDMMLHYVTALVTLAMAALITIVWTAVDRARTEYRVLHERLLVLVRFSLAAVMFGYGFIKIFPLQMREPGFERLLQSLGDFSPMGLLWTFMGYSTPYLAFTGFGEALGALLLCFRRTATLGGLVLIAVLSNVAVLNLTFDVPVKLFSLHLLGMAVFVVAADAPRLWNLFIRERMTAPRPALPLSASPRIRTAQRLAHALVVLWLVGASGMNALNSHLAITGARDARPLKHLAGIYDVTAFSRSAVGTRPSLADSSRWTRVIYETNGILAVRRANDSTTRFSTVIDTTQQTLLLYTLGAGAPRAPIKLEYSIPDSVTFVLSGQPQGDTINVTLRRATRGDFLLNRRPFRWIQERPFNR